MKSIQNQYIDLKEGRMSQANFMRNLRMTMPQYVTNVTSFKDAVRILKNKQILAESPAKEPSEYAGFYEDPRLVSMKQWEDFYEAVNMEVESYYGTYPDLEDWYENIDTNFFEKVVDPFFKEEEGAELAADKILKSFLKNRTDVGGLSEAKKTKLTADQVNNDELRMGIRVEMEHTDDPEKAKKIALDHLAENPFYYTQLKLSGVDTKATPSKEKKYTADKKKDETEMVDKKNQMKTPKGVEKIKASANKATKETNKPVKGMKEMSLVAKSTRGVQKMDATGEKMKKVNVKENKVASTIFGKNANITAGINAIAKGEKPKYSETKPVEIKPKKSAEDKLREAIRKMIKQETFDGRDNLTDVTGENY